MNAGTAAALPGALDLSALDRLIERSRQTRRQQ
jgi:hypothetical protein